MVTALPPRSTSINISDAIFKMTEAASLLRRYTAYLRVG